MSGGNGKLNTERPSVVDLFAGVGGLSLGAERAGFSVIAAVDNDPVSIDMHGFNFPQTRHVEADIDRVGGAALRRHLGIACIDGLIGGPPCQGFSEIGHRRRNDPRNALFSHFFRLVAELRPRFFLTESVPGILARRYDKARAAALAQLPKRYEVTEPFVVGADELGAPTSRKRVFFFGVDTERAPSVRGLSIKNLIGRKVTVGTGLGGLPAVRSEWQDDLRSWRRVRETPNDGFFKRVRGFVPDGVGNEVAIHLYKNEALISGCLGTRHTRSTIRRFERLCPGEIDSVSGAVRLDPKGFCPTIRAGTGPDRGSYQAVRPIHPRSPRVITPREAARLQGFPDWFVFHPTKWHAFRQIGNSVSPIVAEAILHAVKQHLSDN
jgi:DNA (cytosine-5)-methyltransferase 1